MRLYLSVIFFLVLNQDGFGQLNDRAIHDAKGGRWINDTSYIYRLPYRQGKRFMVAQGANSKMSHRGELSLDFKMKSGSAICAARSGVVVAAKDDSREGGLNPAYLQRGNHIIIRHNDGSEARYWHLAYKGVLVKTGDSVNQGQHIGISGNTGYSMFPHLHFQVRDQNGKEILTRFQTKHGPKYLRPGRRYRAYPGKNEGDR